MTAHAKLSPSSADRWLTCTASVAEIERLDALGLLPPAGSTVYADEGTAAHEVRATCLLLGLDAYDCIGQTVYVNGVGYPVTHEMAEHLQPGIDKIRETANGTLLVEHRLDLGDFLPDQFGTLDAGWYDSTVLRTSDLKYGAGEPVSAERNRQQLVYALGLWYRAGCRKVERIEVWIDQPRAGGLKDWSCSLDELLVFEAECREAYRKIATGQVEFAPSPKACRWCRAKKPYAKTGYMGCKAYNDQQIDIFADAFDDLDAPAPAFPDPGKLSRERRAYIVLHAKEAERWLASVYGAALGAALIGDPDPGIKAIKGRMGARYYTDKAAAEALLTGALGDAAYKPREIVGITDAEKALKPGRKKPGFPATWDALQALINQKPGQPVLVASDHPDAPIVTWDAGAFDDLETEELET